MLNREENELLTRVGPGTPMGDLLRRYWQPIAPVQDLTDLNPTRFVRLMGEDLVLFRDLSGGIGLIQDRCLHRGSSLLFGRVEERGLACAYHGWLYDSEGNCLETPCEPANSQFHLNVKTTAYPVQAFLGLYWAYLGPAPAPVIPRYDVWVDQTLKHTIVMGPDLDCNWLQAVENATDPYHSAILHQDASGKPRLHSTTRGLIDGIDHIDCWQTSFGVIKRQTYRSGWRRQHPWIFPNILALEHQTQFSVPIDDTHTARIVVYNTQLANAEESSGEEPGAPLPTTYSAPYKSPADPLHPYGNFKMHEDVLAQDHMAWETQGPIADRTSEKLGSSDRWIVLLRRMFQENLRAIQEGQDPFALVRDPNHAPIPTEMWSEGVVADRFTEAARP